MTDNMKSLDIPIPPVNIDIKIPNLIEERNKNLDEKTPIDKFKMNRTRPLLCI